MEERDREAASETGGAAVRRDRNRIHPTGDGSQVDQDERVKVKTIFKEA